MNATALRYKIPKKEKLENKKRKKEEEARITAAVLQPTPTPAPAQAKLLIALKKKFNALSESATAILSDALEAHSHVAQIKNPLLRESCHENINTVTHREIQQATDKITELQKLIPEKEKKLSHELEDYKKLLIDMVENTLSPTNIDTDTQTIAPSSAPRLGG